MIRFRFGSLVSLASNPGSRWPVLLFRDHGQWGGAYFALRTIEVYSVSLGRFLLLAFEEGKSRCALFDQWAISGGYLDLGRTLEEGALTWTSRALQHGRDYGG